MLQTMFSAKNFGFIVSNMLSIIMIGATQNYFHVFEANPWWIVLPEIIIVPFMMGVISAWFWRKIKFERMQLAAWSCYNILTALLLSASFLKGYVVALIIIGPILMLCTIIGASTGRAIFK